MSSNQPKKIYRYQGFSSRSMELLCNDQLFFSDPAAFNDPLDCKPSIESNSEIKDLRLILSTLVQQRISSEVLESLNKAKIKGEEAKNHAKKIGEESANTKLALNAYFSTNPDYEMIAEEAENELLTFDIQKEILERSKKGICCFSSVVNNHLLWSHYGDQHHGICIGYNLDRNPKPKLHKAIYGGNRILYTSLLEEALLRDDSDAKELLDEKIMLQKAPAWRYERECRLIGNKGVQSSPLLLKDITFGLRCPTAVIFTVISALESRENIEFYKIHQVNGSFKLKRKPFDTDEMNVNLPRSAKSGIEIFSVDDEGKFIE